MHWFYLGKGDSNIQLLPGKRRLSALILRVEGIADSKILLFPGKEGDSNVLVLPGEGRL